MEIRRATTYIIANNKRQHVPIHQHVRKSRHQSIKRVEISPKNPGCNTFGIFYFTQQLANECRRHGPSIICLVKAALKAKRHLSLPFFVTLFPFQPYPTALSK